MISAKGRYAPSPTGPLHLGNLRTALLAWLGARLQRAEFILRMDDLDLPRVKKGAAQMILQDLTWLGLDWDKGPVTGLGPDQYYQSQRTALYDQALRTLQARGLIYPCYCSRKDIREAASAPHGTLPVYPGTCRDKYSEVTPENEVAIDGRLPAWRFQVNSQVISFKDNILGSVSQNLATEVGDFVLRRSDGLFAYQLAVVVDDSEMGITEVLRGEDLLDSTCRQIALYQALNLPVPNYWHVALMLDQTGNRMAKRDGSCSLAQLRQLNQDPEEIVGKLAYSCGLIDEIKPMSPQQLLTSLTLQSFVLKLKKRVSGEFV